ncbi:hypothetical protein [Gimesia maris]|uniref:hypothetical protein n=1 Tax=Gimesia maris TaxID=122 RepID=UPI00241C1459|nr:hypothetical protein [Gimesia maris]|tara:strand:+ start:118860 stop:119087 length:228 start_codon:yes stop_codon:yes gene_type:complete
MNEPVAPEMAGITCLCLGLALIICATWHPQFLLYRMHADRGARHCGEAATKKLFQLIGIVSVGFSLKHFVDAWFS